MTRKEVKKKMKDRGITQAAIARMGKVSEAMISQLLRGRVKSSRLWNLIHKVLVGDGHA